jgi:hypothetical protein
MHEHSLDLAKSHWQKVHGDITVYGTWFRLDEGWKPAMVLLRTGEERGDHTFPCALMLDDAWIFDERKGDAARAITMAIGFAEAMRMAYTDRKVVHRIFTIIHDHLGDLISIPPRPWHDPVVTADLILTNRNTGKSREILITESS